MEFLASRITVTKILIRQKLFGLLRKNTYIFLTLEFWEGGSLSPEWSDQARTPAGIEELNPLGYDLFNLYIKPVLSKPSLSSLRSIYQDNDSGVSGYQAD